MISNLLSVVEKKCVVGRNLIKEKESRLERNFTFKIIKDKDDILYWWNLFDPY